MIYYRAHLWRAEGGGGNEQKFRKSFRKNWRFIGIFQKIEMDFYYLDKYNPKRTNKMSAVASSRNKGNQNSTSRIIYDYKCTCGWEVSTREGKSFDLLIRLHHKKCEGDKVVMDSIIKRKYTNGLVKKQSIVDVTERRLE